ncbi:hypothetical protein BDN71DRAFT_1396754 [Pleurotus eryngii]|uniref:Transcription factor CBF/NF-Y/archaeal histone domain-containing protein n=1 Tax=Pleurotus eryngii TaxID=5323 RepID=A0A9P5ZQG0_PLEER|nr:hypothetical protein BDN71DRAFT_1396754 [Pleurotus eryngii]
MKNRNKQTKFPVARIKKIMQKDEEVGKVAQATPIVICTHLRYQCSTGPAKALELFLNMIIEEASNVTVERGSKKVEAYHLKHAVETTEMLDFLKELVESVPDPSNGGTIDMDAQAPTNGEAPEGKKRRTKSKKAAAHGDAPPPKRRRKKKSEPVMKEEEDGEEEENGENRMEEDDEDE